MLSEEKTMTPPNGPIESKALPPFSAVRPALLERALSLDYAPTDPFSQVDVVRLL